MKEGFLVGGGLIFAGLMLELSVGPVDWDAFRWPVNGIVLAGFLGIIAIIYLPRKKVYGFLFIGTYKAAIPALIYAVVLTVIMGLTRQTVDGRWLNNMLSFWPFILIYVYIAVTKHCVEKTRLTVAGLCGMGGFLTFWHVALSFLLHSAQCERGLL